MSSFFGSDGSFVLQFAVIFAVILVVLTAGVLLVRRFGGGGGLSAKPGQRSRQPRLGIVDVYELDRQRQLILLRRDNVEHLLLVGGPNDVVIERNIQRGQRLPDALLREERAAEPAQDPVSAIEARRPEPPFFEEVPASFDMPTVVAAPTPGSTLGSTLPPPSRQPLTPVDLPSPLGDREAVAPVRAMPAPFVPEPPPSLEARPVAAELPAKDVPPQKPPAQATPAPESRSRFLRRSAPALVNPRPDVASERPRSEPSFAGSSSPAEPVAVEPALAEPAAAPPVSMPPQRTVDAAILSDMARQLEIALSRPATAVTPPPRGATPAPGAAVPSAQEPDGVVAAVEPQVIEPEFVEPQVVEPKNIEPKVIEPKAEELVAVDPIAAAMAGPPPEKPDPVDMGDGLFEEIVAVEQISPPPVAARPSPPAEEPAPAPTPPMPIAPAETSAPIVPPAAPIPVAADPKEATKPAKASPPNPFSVEEIEAEFARLLGRPLEKRR